MHKVLERGWSGNVGGKVFVKGPHSQNRIAVNGKRGRGGKPWW